MAPHAKAPARDSAGTPQRAIKYSKSSTALRQHVAEVEKPTPTVRLLVRQPPAHTQEERQKTAQPRAVQAHRLRRGASSSPREVAIATAQDLGEFVHQTRRRQGLSQEGLAQAAGTGRHFVSELEAGKPTLELERALWVCEALGLSLLAIAPDD
ncbi:helix-turn-helix domain-containing protein [Novosphingobium sp. Gsoil 351]|uniref:helix-turn-helix domain-containing protein n=1 Tax=Novosphingobium sp. Gsoil 351 TaxID=2675225 RepID=UPI0012B4D0F3|nr:helix-turn-helix domain-containing protein [Novosphingobium sp. Gsoil 351]QGN55743.1 helix-turn-helix domain-containing protein [Novosphingobium sp. Gsoil 351]